jgi:hypothetical protein
VTNLIEIADILPADCSAAQLADDLLADSGRFSYEVEYPARRGEPCDCLEAALRLASEWCGVGLSEIVVQDKDEEDGAYRLWVYPDAIAMESSDVLGGDAWVDEDGCQHPTVSVICSPIPEDSEQYGVAVGTMLGKLAKRWHMAKNVAELSVGSA